MSRLLHPVGVSLLCCQVDWEGGLCPLPQVYPEYIINYEREYSDEADRVLFGYCSWGSFLLAFEHI